MNKILSYELISLFLGKTKFKLLIGILLLALIYLIMALSDGIPDGITALGECLSFTSSIMVFITPIFAGQFLAQSFENRMIQNSIMAGQRRTSIVIGKSLYFFFLSMMFLLMPTIIDALIITIVKGWNNSGLTLDTGTLLIQALLFLLLISASYMVNVPIAFYFKKTGPTIGFGLLISILLYSFTQELVQRESLHSLIKWIPLGNSYFVFTETSIGLVKSFVVALLWTIICILVTWIIFRKDELK